MKAYLKPYGWYVANEAGFNLQPAAPPVGTDAGHWRAVALKMLRRDLRDYFGLSEGGPVRDESGLRAAVRRFPRHLREDESPLPDGLPAPEALEDGVALAHADDDSAQALASFYAGLWTLLRRAGTDIPDEEFAAANDELHGTGWTVRRDGENFTAESSEGQNGLRLAHWEDLQLADDGWKGPFTGERGGTYWVSPSGQKTYAEHHPGRQEAHQKSFPDYFAAVGGSREHPEGVPSVHAAHRHGVEQAIAAGQPVHPLAMAAHPDLHMIHHGTAAIGSHATKPKAIRAALSEESQGHVDREVKALSGLIEQTFDKPLDQGAYQQAMAGLQERTPQERQAIAAALGVVRPGRGGKDTLEAISNKLREADFAREMNQV